MAEETEGHGKVYLSWSSQLHRRVNEGTSDI